MSVIPAHRRRELARAVSAAGLATALAGSALVAGALLPTASADYVSGADPKPYYSNKVCADFNLAPPPAADGWDAGGKVDPPVDIDNEFVSTTITDGKFLTVEPKDGFEIAGVLVKGGQGGGGTAYFNEPFEDLYASKNSKGEYQEISHYTICGEKRPSETTPPTTEPPETTPPTTEPPEAEPGLAILEPVCDTDVPYLEYAVDPEGTDAEDGDVTITWINPDGDDVVYEDLPLAARVLWVGAVVDEDGNPLDWPGWTQLDDGTWVEGDEFDWVRPAVDIVVTVNPEFELTVDYPPSSPICDANPPQDVPPGETLPNTGSNALLAVAGGGLLLGGAALLLLGRRSARSRS